MPTEYVERVPPFGDPQREIILLYRDERHRERVARTLGQAGWTLRPARTVDQARAAVRSATSIVIIDSEQMDEGGTELLATLKADANTSHVLVIFWAYDTPQPPERCAAALEAGVDAVFKGPMDDPELVANVRALMRWQKAEFEAMRAAKRSRFLAELGAALASPVKDVDELLGRMLEVSVPSFADCAAVEVGYGPGGQRHVVVRHVDKAGEPIARELIERLPPSRNPFFENAFAAQEATLLTDVPSRLEEISAGEPEIRRALEELKIQSSVIAPFAGARLRGSLIFGMCTSERRFSADDIPLVAGITHRVTLAIENALLLGALRDQLEFHQRLLGIVGHDLRQPLQAIVIGLQVISKQDASDRVTKLATTALASARRAGRLVEDLLDLTRVQLGRPFPVHCRPAELGELVTKCVEEAGAAHPKRALELDAPEEVNGVWDPERVSQAVMNLISNAMTHGDPSQPVRVRVRRGEGGGVEVSVWNRGPVIPRDHIPALFHPYSSSRGATGHLGLGLFIVEQVARAHGGAVEVTSSAEAGTEFKLKLPQLTGEDHAYAE